jgi:DNA-directed RNA polymerase specialized sigma24 family protein
LHQSITNAVIGLHIEVLLLLIHRKRLGDRLTGNEADAEEVVEEAFLRRIASSIRLRGALA